MPNRRPPAHPRFSRLSGRESSMAGLFLLGLMLFLPPLLVVFNRPVLVFGIPLLYLYLFLAWAALIALIARALSAKPDSGD